MFNQQKRFEKMKHQVLIVNNVNLGKVKIYTKKLKCE